jgi:hypothetical protein
MNDITSQLKLSSKDDFDFIDIFKGKIELHTANSLTVEQLQEIVDLVKTLKE